MFKIYTDKSEDFKCKITVEGSDINNTTARLVLVGKNYTLLFEGDIDNDGNCHVPIKKVKNILSENETGTMRLEVISEDNFFSPWEDDFEVMTSKKVTVEFEEKPKPVIKENKVSVNVDVSTEKNSKIVSEKSIKSNKITENVSVNHGKIISNLLTNEGVKLSNIKENINKTNKIIKQYISNNDVKETQEALLDEIINNLKF